MFPVAALNAGNGDNSWAVSFDEQAGSITIGYGTIFYNGKLLTTYDISQGTVSAASSLVGVGDDQIVFGQDPKGLFVYLHILNPLASPTETDDNKKITLSLETNSKHPDGDDPINANAPLIEYIPLAFVDTDGTVYDMRPKFWVCNFSFLA
jgi:hypothetical protein